MRFSHRLTVKEVLPLTVSHALALAIALHGRWSYPMLQLLFGVEIVLVNIASFVLWPVASIGRALWMLVKSTALLAFLLMFVGFTYQATLEDVEPTVNLLKRLDFSVALSSACYIAVSMGMSLVSVRREPDPRMAWTRTRIATSGSTFVAMFVMIFVTIFAAKPALDTLRDFGVAMPVDPALICCMIGLRYAVMLFVNAAFSARDWDMIARQPYA
jgi:hypothetical protein